MQNCRPGCKAARPESPLPVPREPGGPTAAPGVPWSRPRGTGGEGRLTIHCQKTGSLRRHSRAASSWAFSLSSLRSSCNRPRAAVRPSALPPTKRSPQQGQARLPAPPAGPRGRRLGVSAESRQPLTWDLRPTPHADWGAPQRLPADGAGEPLPCNLGKPKGRAEGAPSVAGKWCGPRPGHTPAQHPQLVPVPAEGCVPRRGRGRPRARTSLGKLG